MIPAPLRARRSGSGRAAAAALLTLSAAAVFALGGCSGSGSSPDRASQVVHSLGAVPVPTAPTAVPTATADGVRPALLEIGAPLRVTLSGVRALVTALGPTQSVEYNGGTTVPTSTVGTFTVQVRVTSGSLAVRAADFSSRDEVGKPVSLRPVGTGSVVAKPGRPAELKISGTYGSGAAQVTWAHQGKVVAVWDFNVELD